MKERKEKERKARCKVMIQRSGKKKKEVHKVAAVIGAKIKPNPLKTFFRWLGKNKKSKKRKSVLNTRP